MRRLKKRGVVVTGRIPSPTSHQTDHARGAWRFGRRWWSSNLDDAEGEESGGTGICRQTEAVSARPCVRARVDATMHGGPKRQSEVGRMFQ
jgi:hypothetical protein